MSDGGAESMIDAAIRGDADSVYGRLRDHLRREVKDVGADPSVSDPALHLLFRVFSLGMADVYQAIQSADDRALQSLLRRFLTVPRGPLPSQTVARFGISDPGRDIDPDTALVGKVQWRDEKGKTHEYQPEFRPRFSSRLGEYRVSAVIEVESSGQATLRVLPAPGRGKDAPAPQSWNTTRPERPYLLFAVDSRVHRPSADPVVFVHGDDKLVRRLLWGRWHAGGLSPEIRRVWTPATKPAQGGHLGSGLLTYRPDRDDPWGYYAERFVELNPTGVPDNHVPGILAEAPTSLPEPRHQRRWWRVEPAGDPGDGIGGGEILTDCLPVENRNEAHKTELVPDLRKQAITLPVTFDELSNVTAVIDLGTGTSFAPYDSADGLEGAHSYILRMAPDERNVAVYLRNPPRGTAASKIEIRYSTNLGDKANNIPPQDLRLLKPEPGLGAARALLRSVGGRPARSAPAIDEEIRGLLRHHGRAVAERDYVDLARSLGAPYVQRVRVWPDVQVTPLGARRCVRVEATVSSTAFVSDNEEAVVRKSVERGLALRSPVGTAVDVVFRKEDVQ